MNISYEKTQIKKVAICFWGLTRSLKYTLHSIEKNIFEPLIKNNIPYDIFIHTYTTNKIYSNPRAEEKNLILDNDEYKLLKPKYYKIENQEYIKKKINVDKYKTMGNPWVESESFSNHLLALWSLNEVTALWTPRAKYYTNVIYCRPDLEYLCPIDIRWLYGSDDVIYTPNFHRKPTLFTKKGSKMSINDRFAIGKPLTMKYYGNRFLEALEYSKTHQLESRIFLEDTLRKHNVKIIFINFVFIRVRATGKRRAGNVRRTKKIIRSKNVCKMTQ
jgi:hypothetical protein